MNKLLKRGFKAYTIFLKNKLAVSLMMLVSGIMMAISAFSGHGNDTKTLPTLITAAGVVFSLWAFYHLGYLKALNDKTEDETQKKLGRQPIVLQILEALAYLVVTAAGVYLLLNESLVNTILNLMVGGFTIFNGIVGLISLIKRRNERNYRWVIRLILTIFELTVGPYFVISSSSINNNGLAVMGILTAVAGLIEVIVSVTTKPIKETMKDTVKDSKDIVKTLKTGKTD